MSATGTSKKGECSDGSIPENNSSYSGYFSYAVRRGFVKNETR